MVAGVITGELRVEVTANSSSNDHQARILIDGVDWIGTTHLGLDPPDLATELEDPSAIHIIVGRCGCGCVGCDDIEIEVERSQDTIAWLHGARRILFDRSQYETEIRRFISDQTWRPLERQVELSVEKIFAGHLLEGRLAFRWASVRIRPNVVCLSFEDGGLPGDSGYEQRVLEFGWDGETIESALDRASSFRMEQFDI
jgi:hypothetical protein